MLELRQRMELQRSSQTDERLQHHDHLSELLLQSKTGHEGDERKMNEYGIKAALFFSIALICIGIATYIQIHPIQKNIATDCYDNKNNKMLGISCQQESVYSEFQIAGIAVFFLSALTTGVIGAANFAEAIS